MCKRKSVELRRSHFLPAGAYRIIRDAQHKNPHPYVITKTGVLQTSDQFWAHLLCSDCEQRFHRNGEDWIFRHSLQKDGRFPLQEILDRYQPELANESTQVFHASNISEISVSALTYFAASIFWRGSIYPWNEDHTYPVKLGAFEERFRVYLMGSGPFPQDCALWVELQLGVGSYQQVVYGPYGKRQPQGYYAYRFPMTGIGFTLTVGQKIDDVFRRMCIAHGLGNPIIRTASFDKWIEQDAVDMVINNPRVLKSIRQGR